MKVNIYSLPFFLSIFLFSCRARQNNAFVRDEVVTPPSTVQQFQFGEFYFYPGRSCNTTWVDSSFCDATVPKQWMQAEFLTIQDLLGDFYSSALSSFRQTIVKNGFSGFYRYAHDFASDGAGHYKREEHAAWVWGRDMSINVSDLAFINVPRDPIGQFDLQKSALLHELAHAFSFNNSSLMADFQKLVGWSEQDNRWQLTGIEMTNALKTIAEMRQLIIDGKVAEGIKLNRDYGVKRGFPSAYSMMNPSECFAEFAAYIFYDSTSSQYLRPEVVTWFKENVLR